MSNNNNELSFGELGDTVIHVTRFLPDGKEIKWNITEQNRIEEAKKLTKMVNKQFRVWLDGKGNMFIEDDGWIKPGKIDAMKKQNQKITN